MTGSPKRKRVVACDLCKARKVRCDGETPCNVCIARGEQCSTTNRPRKREVRVTQDAVHERLRRIESLRQESATSGATGNDDVGTRDDVQRQPVEGETSFRGVEDVSAQHDGGLLSADEASVKYHGPHSALSVCSKPALQWISQKLLNDEFQPAASRLVHIIARQMFRLPSPISRERKPDPPADEAWQYVDAYFAEAPETAFGVVRRDLFQPRLEAHYAGFKKDENPAIYAIRNCIFATGCRIRNAKVLGYSKAVDMASGWFENALSVHTELLYMPTTIISVVALVIMAYYTEGIGGPLLPYMLSSCAIRLACAKGLHCEPASSWNINVAENRHRHRIFWAAYCIDQNIAASNGRPPAISDETISCRPPELEPSDGIFDGSYSMAMVKLQQLHSQVGRVLLSSSRLRDAGMFLEAVRTLKDQIQAYQTTLRPSIDLEIPLDSSRLSTGRERDMIISLHYKYYELLFRIHSSVVYPWFWPDRKVPSEDDVQQAVQESTTILAWVSRRVLISISELRLDPSCRFWMAVVVPLYACIDTFIRMINDPSRASFQSDLALLELSVAHFARLELSSDGKYSIPFARELAHLASDLHNRVRNNAATQNTAPATSPGTATSPTRTANFPNANDLMSMDSWPESVNDILDWEWWNMDFNSWDLDSCI